LSWHYICDFPKINYSLANILIKIFFVDLFLGRQCSQRHRGTTRPLGRILSYVPSRDYRTLYTPVSKETENTGWWCSAKSGKGNWEQRKWISRSSWLGLIPTAIAKSSQLNPAFTNYTKMDLCRSQSSYNYKKQQISHLLLKNKTPQKLKFPRTIRL